MHEPIVPGYPGQGEGSGRGRERQQGAGRSGVADQASGPRHGPRTSGQAPMSVVSQDRRSGEGRFRLRAGGGRAGGATDGAWPARASPRIDPSLLGERGSRSAGAVDGLPEAASPDRSSRDEARRKGNVSQAGAAESEYAGEVSEFWRRRQTGRGDVRGTIKNPGRSPTSSAAGSKRTATAG
jgi:hypothetical protein